MPVFKVNKQIDLLTCSKYIRAMKPANIISSVVIISICVLHLCERAESTTNNASLVSRPRFNDSHMIISRDWEIESNENFTQYENSNFCKYLHFILNELYQN